MKYTDNNGNTYLMSSSLNDFQRMLYMHLIDWKRQHLTPEPGVYKGHTYDYFFPNPDIYEFSPVLFELLHSELRSLQNSIFKYKEHIMAYHMASSQCACINLFMPVLLDANASEILKHVQGCPKDFKEIDRTRLYKGFCFEYWGQDIENKSSKGLLQDHTHAAGTDSDIAIAYLNEAGESCIWLIEHKLAESEFTCCGGYNSEHNKHKSFCQETSLNSLLEDNHKCRYTAVGYGYWNITARHSSAFLCNNSRTGCPFRGGKNQLWRNQLLAFALVDCNAYSHAHFSVVHHRDNEHLNTSMEDFRKIIAPEISMTSFNNDDIVSAAEQYGENLNEWAMSYRELYNI